MSQAEYEAELREALRTATARAETISSDTMAFLEAIQPFGPLDLVVQRAASPDHANELRNFFLGVVSGAARINVGPFVDGWHCGPPCAQARRDTLTSQLPTVRRVIERFTTWRIDVLAAWPDGGYRADSLVFDGAAFRFVSASPRMGFLPWRATPVPNRLEAFSALGASPEDVEWLVGEMRLAGIVAIARDRNGSIRAVLAGGIADNEAGLLFLSPSDHPPSATQPKLWDGRQYVGVEEVEPGVFFYVTS